MRTILVICGVHAILFWTVVLWSPQSVTSAHLDFFHPDNCSETWFFDTNKMSCEPCLPAHLYPNIYNDYRHQKNLQIKSEDGYSCVCRPGFRPDLRKSVPGRALFCSNDTTECPSPSRLINGFQCAVCLNGELKPNKEGSEECRCPKGYHLVQSANTTHEIVMNLKCEKCHKHYNASSDGQSCQPCHQSFIEESDSCECPDKTHTEEDGMCLATEKLKELKKENALFDLSDLNRRFISDFFYRRTYPALYNCKIKFNRTACQLLANLCVLNYYSYSDKPNSESNVCKFFVNFNNVLQIEFEIYYKTFFSSVLEQFDVPNQYRINDEMQLIARRFSLNGQITEYSDLMIGELQLCYENEKTSKSGFVFNTNFRQKCVRTAKDLLNGYHKKNIFYELFLKNYSEGKITLYPIPLLIKNVKRNNKLVNIGVDEYDTDEELHQVILTRRFFLIDTITGVEKLSDDSDIDYREVRPKFLRIAKSIAVDVKLRKQDGKGAIFPPLITIEYETIELSDENDNPDIEIEFNVTYSMDDWKSQRDLSIAISVLCFSAVLWAIFRTWCWAKRNGKVGLDFFTLTEFVMNTIGWLSIVFFVVNIVFAINIFIVYKNQSVIHTLLPTESQETSLIIYVIIAFVLKFIHLLYRLLVISTIDIFFLDWERPKKRDNSSLVTISRPKSASTLDDNESLNRTPFDRQIKSASGISITSQLTSPSPKLIPDKSLTEFPNVTVWRSNFVANEWSELCGHRRLSLSFHILLTILFLDVSLFLINYCYIDNNLVCLSG